VVISGPAGVGKNTVAERLCERLPLHRIVTATTRPPRPGEDDGRDYIFLSEDEFRRRIKAGRFLEWAAVHGQLYGTPREAVDEAFDAGQTGLLLIDVQGAMQVKEVYPDALLIFLDAPDRETLDDRLAQRSTEDEAERERRLATARVERQYRGRYDFHVVNDDLDRTVTELVSIIRAQTGQQQGGQN
jgi:guanylate kinase